CSQVWHCETPKFTRLPQLKQTKLPVPSCRGGLFSEGGQLPASFAGSNNVSTWSICASDTDLAIADAAPQGKANMNAMIEATTCRPDSAWISNARIDTTIDAGNTKQPTAIPIAKMSSFLAVTGLVRWQSKPTPVTGGSARRMKSQQQ